MLLAPVLVSVIGLHGQLLICGGGKLPDEVYQRFLAVSPDIVVIPTATERADHPEYRGDLVAEWRCRGARNVTVLHTRNRDEANDTKFASALADAKAVWLSGGDQCLLTQAYRGTEVEKQLKLLLARGGIIAGTSAGAAVMSEVMIAGGDKKAILGEGFGFVKGAIVDQHFLRRNRHDRLADALATHPDLVGLGIDEETAVLIEMDGGPIQVLGKSYVVILDGHMTFLNQTTVLDGRINGN